MEVSGLGVKLELQLKPTPQSQQQDLSCILYLHCSLEQCCILNTLREAKDWTWHPHGHYTTFLTCWVTPGTPASHLKKIKYYTSNWNPYTTLPNPVISPSSPEVTTFLIHNLKFLAMYVYFHIYMYIVYMHRIYAHVHIKFFVFYFILLLFRATQAAYGSSWPRGPFSCSSWPTPQPQHCRIWAASETYIAAHGNARSLTHWKRPGI